MSNHQPREFYASARLAQPRWRYARFTNGRTEHVVIDGHTSTRCGKDARTAAKFYARERGQDAKLRPLCRHCYPA